MRPFHLTLLVLGLVLASLEPACARPFTPCLADFLGSVYAPPAELQGKLGLGMVRLSQESDWNAVEPAPGEWRFARLDQAVLDLHERGLEVLLMLGYTATWASSAPDGKGTAPPKRVADWERYVETLVARYSRPPFNVKFFQPWNEPKWSTPTGFWTGSGEQFVDSIHIPAARIIRRYGAKVVFGGWPINNAGDLERVLNYHDCWRWVDVIDVHYYPTSVYQQLWEQYLSKGKCEGLWQSEIGFLDFPNYLPNAYLRILYWALGHDWDTAYKYRVCWYASWGAGPDGPKCLTKPGPDGAVLSRHGLRQATLVDILGKGRLKPWKAFTSDLGLAFALDEEKPALFGFAVGEQRKVIALLLTPEVLQRHTTAHFSLSGLPPGCSMRLVDAVGKTYPVKARRQGEDFVVTVPLQVLEPAVARNYGKEFKVAPAYLVIDESAVSKANESGSAAISAP